jgi:uncharacterized protein (DUF1800 family)
VNESKSKRVDRRDLLRWGTALIGTSAMTGSSRADQPENANLEIGPNGLPDWAQPVGSRGKPSLPPLDVIALTRLGFGPRPGDLEAFRNIPGKDAVTKLKTHLESQLDPASIDDAACDEQLKRLDLKTLEKPLEKLWLDHRVNRKEDDYDTATMPARDTRLATLTRMVHSKRQLQEVLVDFWHNHFNTTPERDDRIASVFVSYDRDVIRKHALGNFRTMLGAVATHPAMLYYLDNASNSRAGPNENYARELFELHTMGAENYLGVKRQSEVPGFDKHAPVGYVDDDVYEACRCFTGWRVNDNTDEPGLKNTGTFTLYAPNHDRFQKTVLGQYFRSDGGFKDGVTVLDMLAAHPGTSRFIARKLCRRLISDNPPQRVVDEAARIFREQAKAPDQLKQVVRFIALSDEFRTTWGEKIKRPLESMVSILRVLEAEFEKYDSVWWAEWFGQPIFGHRPPDGYADTMADWGSTQSILRRWQFAISTSHGFLEHFKVDVNKTVPENVRTPTAIADFWIPRLLGRALRPEHRAEVIKMLAQDQPLEQPLEGDALTWNVRQAVALVLMTPDFQWR